MPSTKPSQKKSMNNRFIYDESSSSLYAPDGSFLKKLYCPKAMHWNQLVVDTDDQRWRNCTQCKEQVLNLDEADTQYALQKLTSRYSTACVHVSSSSDKVIFLKDAGAPPAPMNAKTEKDRVTIHTVRSVQDIGRAVGMGYWPDVRMLQFDTKNLRTKVSVGQDPETGAIETTGDLRMRFRTSPTTGAEKLLLGDGDHRSSLEAIPFTNYYPYFQKSPIAAYLIPRDIKEGALVVVEDPIEDIVGTTWNQGSAYRAYHVPGYIKDRKVVLQPESVRVSHAVG